MDNGDSTIPVLYDTDIGSDIDDALALTYLLAQPRCELIGITTVSGEPEKRAEIASVLSHHAGREDLPIYPGAERPLLIAPRQRQAPQSRALGDWPRQRRFPAGEACAFLREHIRRRPGEITLLATGPQTNVALLFATDPELPAMLRQLVVMGGQFFPPGTEWNIRCDPHAAAIVYAATGRPGSAAHVALGLDVTTKCRLEADVFRRRTVGRRLEPVRDFAEVFLAENRQVTFHDPLAAACVFRPGICRYRSGRVELPLETDAPGRTHFTEAQDGPHRVACEVDPEAFFEEYFSVVE